VFGRDMISNIQHVAKQDFIRHNKQMLIDKNNKAEKAKIAHLYKVREKVLLRRGTENKS